jgi:hypothetical protein
MRGSLSILLFVVSTIPFGALWAADDDHCLGGTAGAQTIVTCHTSRSAMNSGQHAQQISGNARYHYQYLWLPACPEAIPGSPDATLHCAAAHLCPDPLEIRVSLWLKQVAAHDIEPGDSGWQYVATKCRDPRDLGPVKRRTLTWQNVLEAIRRVGVPAAHVNAPGFTLVNLRTTFYTEPQAVSRSLQLVGFDVDVHVTPSSYTWHWGDGSTSSTTTPGRPYPSTDVTHTFEHATRDGPALQVSVDATYTAQYRVDGGPWLRIPDTLTIAGPSTSLPVKQASAVLVADN